ncbi:MAG: pitrilysin family protein [Candidatus Acidiferrales bacterium]|jgi:zinc protease
MTPPATTASGAHVTSAPPLGPERQVAWPARSARTLPNGLEVVLAESHTFPKIIAELFFRSGNAATALTSPGLAEMTAAVVRTGTASRGRRAIEEDLRSMGADLGTTAGADTSAISIAGLAEFAKGLLELVSDLARNASFPDDEFERIRRQRIEGLRIERTTPGFLGSERLRRTLFGGHPYAIIAPTEAQVESYRREDLQAYYREHYTPANALLVIVGDFKTAEMFELVEKVFAGWSGVAPKRTPGAALPDHHGRRVQLIHMPGTVQTEVLIGNRAITRLHPDWFRLLLANSIFGGAFNSRLVMNIREQKGYTYSPRSAVSALREYGYFSVHAAVRNDVVAATLTETFYELDRMRSVPVGEEELSNARNYMTGVFSLGVATQDGMMNQLATVYLHGLPPDYLETYRERIRSLTSQDVLLAARRHFDSANAQIVIVGDRDQIGEQAGLFADVKQFDASGREI